MKARTKIEKEVLELRKRLPELTETQKEWAKKECFEHIGYYWKSVKIYGKREKVGKVWCQDCGHEEYVSVPELAVSLNMKHTCQGCGHHIDLKSYRDECHTTHGRREEKSQFSVITSMGEWTITRTFVAHRENGLCSDTTFRFWEIWQVWIRDDGKEVILTKKYTRSPFHFAWSYGSEWGVGRHNGGCSGYYERQDVYDTYGNWFYPRQRVSRIMKRNGWCSKVTESKVDVVELQKLLLVEPMAEELMKTRQFDILAYWMRTGSVRKDRNKWLHAVRICNRNHYQVKDASLWFDYLDLLEYFNKDTHNAKYVCPENLSREHDRLVKKKNRLEKEAELKRNIQRVGKYEGAYKKNRGMFFGICFGNKDIVVTVIGSVREMLEEGVEMGHCVFANGYYDMKRHPDSLILSAKDRNGNRLETVEVNIKTWKIMQSRGVHNHATGKHSEIVALVEKNMGLLMKAA